MNLERACKILDLGKNQIDKNIIKQAYKKQALKTHPDKNNKPQANEEFSEIHSAYQYLLKINDQENAIENSFTGLTNVFCNYLDQELQREMLQDLSTKLLFVCEKQSIKIIDELESNSFHKIYKLYIRYKNTFRFSLDFQRFMENKKIYWFSQGNMKKNRSNEGSPTSVKNTDLNDWNDEYVLKVEPVTYDTNSQKTMIIRPTLEDVLFDNVYQYFSIVNKVKERYLIPLWHHELAYDHEDCEFIVKIIPQFPSDNYWIDDENTLHQRIEFTMSELWNILINNTYIDVFFGKKRFVLYPYNLKIQKEQTWCWENQGVSLINNQNIFDVSKRGHVILHIFITSL
uniref:J domain-containing protein n=1 Tax=viral metagenome TaxID=1070528 RepID=A0A6C0CLB9_9ZZZZ